MKNKKSKKKIREIKLQMRFNPGTMSYEPIFSKNIKDYSQKNDDLDLSWKKIISAVGIIIIIILLITILMSFT